MPRIGRIVAAGFPHHGTQRGNRRQKVFFEAADYALYRDLLAERCRKTSVRCVPKHGEIGDRPHFCAIFVLMSIARR